MWGWQAASCPVTFPKFASVRTLALAQSILRPDALLEATGVNFENRADTSGSTIEDLDAVRSDFEATPLEA